MAAFALSAKAQESSTRVAPANPVMPYRVDTVPVGTCHGTVVLTATTPGESDADFTNLPAGMAYSTATVKIAITPDTHYAIRDSYPKVYKTGDSKTTITLKPLSDTDKTPTFEMPKYPVSIGIAYNELLDSIRIDTLALVEKPKSVEEVIPLLPNKLLAVFESGKADSVAVGKWALKSGSTFDAGFSAINRFSCTFSLPDSVSLNGKELTGYMDVANPRPITAIGSEADLLKFAAQVNAGADYKDITVVLKNDVLLTKAFTPIGGDREIFAGTFDGQGYAISELNINIKAAGDLRGGLFGYIGKSGMVKNLGVKGGTISVVSTDSYTFAGGIAGENEGTISNCYTDVTVGGASNNSEDSYGGIVGYNRGTITHCYATGAVTSIGYAGGIAGYGDIDTSVVSYCFATGKIKGLNAFGIGGGAGVQHCIALNTEGIEITAFDGVGNRIISAITATSFDNYASPLIPGKWIEKGTDQPDGADLEESFATDGSGTGAFTGWTTDHWDFGTTTVNLPMLAGFKSDQPAKDLKRISYMAIPVLISTKEELAAIAGKDSLYRLANNINLGNVDWTPIDGFSGILDGAGFMVSGLKVAATGDGEVYAGLFGSTKEKSVIRNLGVIGTVEAASTGNSVWAGGIVGKSNSRIENCYSNVLVKSTGTVTDKQSYAGGITGQIYSGYVNNCYALGNCTVEGKGGSYVGGIAGYLSGENTIDYCYATGTIAGSKDTGVAGGIVGNVENGTLTNCIALNTRGITGNAGRANRVAGLGGTITCCYASPLIKVNDILVIGNSDTSDRQGANLTTDNFLVAVSGVENVFNSWVKETNWSFDADHAEIQAFFLPTVCTIEEGTVIAGQSVPMPSRSSFLLKTIEITDAVTYDEAVHKGNEIIVKDGGVFTAKAAGGVVKYLTVEAGGMLVASQLKVEGVYTMKVDLVNKWRTFSTPIALVADKQFAGSDDDKDKLWLRTFNFADQTWNLATELATSTAYLLASDNIAGETVTFTAANFVFPATAGIDNTGDANDGIFTFTPNPCVDKTVVSNVYMLNAAGTVFELQASTAVEPFQACMVANAATQLRVKSFSIDGGITGMEAAAADGFHAYADGGKIYIHTGQPADVVVYSLNGLLVKKLASLHGDTSLELPGGAYVVRCNGKSIKVINYE